MLNGAAAPFHIEGGLLLAAIRACWVAALLSVFGTLVFRLTVAPVPNHLVRGSIAAALATGMAWFLLQAQGMADADTPRQLAAALPTVLLHTAFGHILAAQLLLMLALLLPWGTEAALALAMAATALQAEHGHAAAMEPGFSWLLTASIVHLLGAGAWLGGLLPLWHVVRTAPVKDAAIAARRFSPIGRLAVAAVAASAAFQGWVMIGSIPAIPGTAYGWMASVKLALLAVLLGFAWVNRYRFAPALLHANAAAARRTFVRSIAFQTAAGVSVIAAAAVLSALPPGMHTQSVWPFTQQFSLTTIQEDPGFKREVIAAALALAAAAALLVLAVTLRSPRWLRAAAAAAACGLAWVAIPHFDLLFVEAYPTSYATSPTGFAAATIVQGAALYPGHCAACHGASGHGDGPAAAGLTVPPADLTADHLWMHNDGDLIWWLSHGIDDADGHTVMPGFAAALPEESRWALIDYIRAHNAGTKADATGAWSPPIQAPAFQAACGGRVVDLHGRIVRLIIGADAPGPPNPDVLTILATPSAGPCTTNDATVPLAYAIVTGVPAGAIAGSEFLIDGDGWLRAVQRPGDAARWSDPAALASVIHDIAAHPIQDAAPAAMHMQM